jgi:O-antigen/teichoic acid export membrane protein
MSFARKGLLASASQVSLALMSMLSSVVYARFLGPAGVGQLALLLSTVALAVPVLSLGVGTANVYFLNSRQVSRQETVSHSLTLSLVLGAALTLALAAAFRAFPAYFGELRWSVLLAFSLGGACQLLIALLRSVLVAELAVRRMVAVNVLQHLVVIVLILALGLAGSLRVESALCVVALGSLCSAGLLLLFLGRDVLRLRRFELGWLTRTAGYGLKLAANGILVTLISSLTVMLIRYQLPQAFAALGLYTRAAAIAGLVVLIPRALSPLLYARWSDVDNDSRVQQCERVARFNVLYGLLAAAGLVLLGQYAILVLYGRAFLAAQQTLVILAPAMVFACLFSVFNILLASDGRAALTTAALAGAVLITGALTLLLVPRHAERGAALAVLAGNAFSALATGLICRRLYGLRLRRMLLVGPGELVYLWRKVRVG